MLDIYKIWAQIFTGVILQNIFSFHAWWEKLMISSTNHGHVNLTVIRGPAQNKPFHLYVRERWLKAQGLELHCLKCPGSSLPPPTLPSVSGEKYEIMTHLPKRIRSSLALPAEENQSSLLQMFWGMLGETMDRLSEHGGGAMGRCQGVRLHQVCAAHHIPDSPHMTCGCRPESVALHSIHYLCQASAQKWTLIKCCLLRP